MNNKVLFSFLGEYKVNFFLLILTISVGFFLIVFLLNMSKYKDYYFEYKYGSVPEWIVLDPNHNVSSFDEKIKKGVDESEYLRGQYLKLDTLAFKLDQNDLSFISKDVYLFGFDFDKVLELEVECDKKKTKVKVSQIYSTHSTRWKIKTDGFKDFTCESNEAEISFEGLSSEINIKRQRSKYTMFEFDPTQHKSEHFYLLMIKIAKSYMKVFHPGRKNSVTTGEKADLNPMSSRYKEPLENFFSLIFSSKLPKVLSGGYLANQISNYEHVSQRYHIEHLDEEAELVIRDVINFPLQDSKEHFQLANSMFMKMSVLPEFSEPSEKGNFAFIYTPTIKVFDKDLAYISKQELLPKYKEQKEFIENIVFAGVAMVAFYIFVILAIALTRFYAVFGKDIFLLKVYASKLMIFIRIVFLGLAVSTVISYIGLVYSFEFINSILMQYYQPIMHFNTDYLWIVLGFSTVGLALLLAIEYFFWRRLWISIK